MVETRILKQLQSQLKNEVADIEVLKIEISNKQKDLNQKQKNIERIKSEISKLENQNKTKKIKISEHALVRYFERVKGYNIEEIEKEILSEPILKMVSTLGNSGKFPNKDFTIVMKDNTVTTII